MKKLFFLTLMFPVTLLTACGDSSSSGTADGRFKATIGDRNIDVEVKCRSFQADADSLEFVFSSDDNTAAKDTNGDGIIVWGSRIKIGKDKSPLPMDGISLDVVIDGESYSVIPAIAMLNQKQEWTRSSTGISGKDQLMKEGETAMKKYPITYEVVCK